MDLLEKRSPYRAPVTVSSTRYVLLTLMGQPPVDLHVLRRIVTSSGYSSLVSLSLLVRYASTRLRDETIDVERVRDVPLLRRLLISVPVLRSLHERSDVPPDRLEHPSPNLLVSSILLLQSVEHLLVTDRYLVSLLPRSVILLILLGTRLVEIVTPSSSPSLWHRLLSPCVPLSDPVCLILETLSMLLLLSETVSFRSPVTTLTNPLGWSLLLL